MLASRLLVAVVALVLLLFVPSVEALSGFQEFDINAIPGRGFQKPDQIPGFNPTSDGGAIHSASGCHVTKEKFEQMGRQIRQHRKCKKGQYYCNIEGKCKDFAT